MSLLDNLPDRCTIRRRATAVGPMAGTKTALVVEQTSVKCWRQNASHREINEYEKNGIVITDKVYFTADPGVTERHEILITEAWGVAVASPDVLEVRSEAEPDASVGLDVVYKVMTRLQTGSST